MKLEVARATEADNGQILSLLSSTPQPGAISLSFERSPNYFHGAAVITERPDVYVLRTPGSDSHTTMGLFNIGTRRLFINGELQSVRYLHDLRLAHGVRGTRALGLAFQTTRELMDDHELFQAVVLEDNQSFLATMMRPRAAGFVLLSGMIIGVLASEYETFLTYSTEAGTIVTLLCGTAMTLGWFCARLFRLNRAQSISIVIEVGIQNTLLVLVIAGLLERTWLTIPAMVYVVVSSALLLVVIAWANLPWGRPTPLSSPGEHSGS